MDADTLSAVIRGEPGPVRAFVREFTPSLRAVIRRLLPRVTTHREEDLLQELMVALFCEDARALRAWDPVGGRSLRTFLCVFAHRRVIDQLRRANRREREQPTEEQDLERFADGAQGSAAPAEAPPWLEPLMQRFRLEASAEDWEFLTQCFVDEIDVTELARRLNLSPAAVYQRRHRLKQRMLKLKEQVLAELPQPPGPPDPSDPSKPARGRRT